MAKARNRNLAGLAGLAAMGAMMAKGFKRGPGEAEPSVEDRGDMVRPAAPAASSATPAAVAPATIRRGPSVDEEGYTLNDEGQRYYLGAASTPASAAPGRPAAAASNRSMAAGQAAASRPAPVSYSAAEAATDLARESTRGVKPAAATPAAPAASSRGLTLGTPTRPAPGAPSIYAGREAWADYRRRQAEGMKKGGKVKKMASGGSVSSASKRGDGIAQRGKTRGRMI